MEDRQTGISRFTMLALSNVIAVALILTGSLYFFWQDDLERPVVRVAQVKADLSSAKNSILQRMAAKPVDLAPIIGAESSAARQNRKMSRLIPAPQVNSGSKRDALFDTAQLVPVPVASPALTSPLMATGSVASRAVTAKRITPDASYDLAYAAPAKPRLLDTPLASASAQPVSGLGKSDRADRVRVASIAPQLPVMANPQAPVIAKQPKPVSKAETVANKRQRELLAKVKHKERESYCLSAAIYYESGYEPKRGKEAVAQVILNRKAHKDYPNTICGVVFHNDHMRNRCQFSFACDGKPERPKNNRAWADSVKVAASFLDKGNRMRSMRKATHYHADYVRPKWASKLNRISKIGAHIFYSVPKVKKRRYASYRKKAKKRRYASSRKSKSGTYRRKGRRVFKMRKTKPNLLASFLIDR